MRVKKPMNGKVTGVKFALNGEKEETDLKKIKARTLKEIAASEKDKKEWYDKELDKNLNNQK